MTNNTIIQFNIKKLVSDVLTPLLKRSRDIVERRFGLTGGQCQTLESIGEKYGITRERVRQIENDAVSIMRAKSLATVKPFFDFVEKHLAGFGNLRREQKLFTELCLSDLSQAAKGNGLYPGIAFLLSLNKNFARVPESEDFYESWSRDRESFKKAKSIIINFINDLNKKNRTLNANEVLEGLRRVSQKVNRNYPLTDQALMSYFDASRGLEQNPFGEFGLVGWSEISPRGVKDKAYLILKKNEKPLHFREIAKLINEAGFLSERQAHFQTVHNELIKDQRFVLVGRGTYALRDWGYEPGTVRDVILSVFQETKRSLSREEIIQKVLAKRLVKENTILLNLQNKNYFKKLDDGRYWIFGKKGIVEEA